jgi:hypothetical protein
MNCSPSVLPQVAVSPCRSGGVQLRRAVAVLAVVVLLGGCRSDNSQVKAGGTAPTGLDGQPLDPNDPTGTGPGATGKKGSTTRGTGSGGTTDGSSGTGGTGGGTTGSTGTGTNPTGPGTTSSAPGQTVEAQLADASNIEPFGGFNESPPPGHGLGDLDLERASGGDASERDALSTAGFSKGYARGWTTQTEDITTIVYQLGSDAKAQAYLKDTIERSIKGNGSATFDVGVTGATGYREQGTDAGGQQYIAWGAVFVRGSRFYEQILRGPREGNTRSEADARALCQRQAQRVGG